MPVTKPDAEMRERFDVFRREHKDDKLGGVANRLLHEDDKVKIWEMRLEPGECSDLHTHERDYYLVVLEGDRVAGVSTDGSEDVCIELAPGPVTLPVDGGRTEWALNIGQKLFREILVELKE